MSKLYHRSIRRLFVGTILAVAVVAFVCTAWSSFGSKTDAAAVKNALSGSTVGDLPNYDIRNDKSALASDLKSAIRSESGKSAVDIDTIRNNFIRGESRLRTEIPGLKIEYNAELQNPEVIATDASNSAFEFLSGASSRSRSDILRGFIKENSELVGMSNQHTDALIKLSDYTNPDGNLSFASFKQRINGIPVFQGEIKAGFTRDGRIIRVINDLAPGLSSLNTDFRDPVDAVRAAAGHIGPTFQDQDLVQNKTASTRNKAIFGKGDWATTAEKVYFPTEPGVAAPAWAVLLWLPEDAYYVVVDAETGALLWRKKISERQTATATFNVYGNLTSSMQTADSPTPFSPGCTDPNNCTQPPIIARTNFTLVGNEAPNAFNNIGWIPDTGLPVRTPANPNITDGNNVEAGLDRDGTQGVDPDGHAVGNPTRVFNYAYNPAPGNPPPGDDPSSTPFRNGVITQGFYLVNRWHDEMYKLGFNEQSGNFQHFNFGRGGSEGDRVSMEIQDSSGTNGANFATPPDGGRGRMQNFLWTGTTPGRDGTLDSTIILHELSHGLSSRLQGNGGGLGGIMAGAMGEGWSDYYALSLLSEPADAACGTYTIGGYISYQIIAGYTANHYYGFRRFPLAKIACLGPNGMPHNPLTFGNLNANNCSTFPSAYPPGPFAPTGCSEVHNGGEIWAAALWEVRGVFIDRLGATEGNRRTLQYVTDAMKISPLNPNFLQSRDAIIAASFATGGAVDAASVREGFRRRGMGANASIISSNNPVSVIENFDFPASPYKAAFDFDGDTRTDVSVYRPSEGNWYIDRSTQGFAAFHWGLSTDKLVPADYDGDARTDIAIFRKGENSTWYILNSATNTVRTVVWGATNIEQAILFDMPVPGDYDGDGKADPAVWRLTDNLSEPARFLILQSITSTSRVQQWGILSDIPVTADFDGDSKIDLAIFRPASGQWWIQQSATNAVTVTQFGASGDKPVPGNYADDIKTEIALWRPSTGEWFVLRNNNTYYSFPFGVSSDLPVPGDYDGDTRTDAAVFRPSNSTWYLNRSTAGLRIQQFGQTGDQPVPNAFVR